MIHAIPELNSGDDAACTRCESVIFKPGSSEKAAARTASAALGAFFLFWPANIVPTWLLATLLQLFIPLNMLMRRLCCIYHEPFRVHTISGLVILLAVGVSLYGYFKKQPDNQENVNYTLLFIVSAFLDVLSHLLKECIVRSQPIDQEKFNLKITISQFIVGVCIAPVVLAISKWKEDYANTPLEDKDELS